MLNLVVDSTARLENTRVWIRREVVEVCLEEPKGLIGIISKVTQTHGDRGGRTGQMLSSIPVARL